MSEPAKRVSEQLRERADRVARQMDAQTRPRPGFGDTFVGGESGSAGRLHSGRDRGADRGV